MRTIEQTLQMQGDGKRAHCAIELVKAQNVEQLRQWISRGQNMNIQDACGFTALMWACMRNGQNDEPKQSQFYEMDTFHVQKRSSMADAI